MAISGSSTLTQVWSIINNRNLTVNFKNIGQITKVLETRQKYFSIFLNVPDPTVCCQNKYVRSHGGQIKKPDPMLAE